VRLSTKASFKAYQMGAAASAMGHSGNTRSGHKMPPFTFGTGLRVYEYTPRRCLLKPPARLADLQSRGKCRRQEIPCFRIVEFCHRVARLLHSGGALRPFPGAGAEPLRQRPILPPAEAMGHRSSRPAGCCETSVAPGTFRTLEFYRDAPECLLPNWQALAARPIRGNGRSRQ